MTLEHFTELWKVLDLRLAIGPSTVGRLREAHEGPWPTEDNVTRYLTEKGLVLGTGKGGRLDIKCPFESEHTSASGVTSTSYFPGGGFKCLHAHCSARTYGEFSEAVGYRGTMADSFDVLPEGTPPTLDDLVGQDPLTGGIPAHVNGAKHTVGSSVSRPWPKLDRDLKTGVIKAHLTNVTCVLQRPDLIGYAIAIDTFRDELVISTPTSRRPFADHDYTCLRLRLAELNFAPVSRDMIRDAVEYVGRLAQYDSAVDWISSLPAWDGTPRVETFYAQYLGAEATPYTQAVGRYTWSALAGRILSPGCQADMVPIWISSQGTGKSSAVKAMAPSPEQFVEINLSEHDDDLSRRLRGKVVAELAELRGLRSKDMEGIKAWVTRTHEDWIPKYKEFATTFPRRLIMIGTSNQDEFLADETGNRRWLPIKVGRQDVEAIRRDRLQLWAEGRALYQAGGIRWQAAEALGKHEHAEFTIQDPWEDDVETYLRARTKGGVFNYVQIPQILQAGLEMRKDQAKPYDERRVAAILRKLGWARDRRYINARQERVWLQPEGWLFIPDSMEETGQDRELL